MMKIQQYNDDAIRLRLIPFALKIITKKWLYNISANSISTWDEFVYPIHKTAWIKNTINQFQQIEGKHFLKYFD